VPVSDGLYTIARRGYEAALVSTLGKVMSYKVDLALVVAPAAAL